MVLEGHITDDAERDEWHLIDIAGLCDAGALHIYSHSLWEALEYLLHLVTTVDKPVASYNQPFMHPCAMLHLLGHQHQLWICLIAWRHAHDLAELLLLTTIGIVIDHLCTYHHIAHLHLRRSTSCTARRDDDVGLILPYHLHRTYGRIDFSDAAFLQHHLIFSYTPTDKF